MSDGEGTAKRGGGGARLAIGMGCGLLVLLGASAVWVRTRPAVTDGELAEAQARLDEEAARQAGESCARPPLSGAATPGDGTAALRRLLSAEGPFAACLALEREALQAGLAGELADGRSWSWDLPEGAPDETWAPGASGGVVQLAMGAPPYPDALVPGVFVDAREACAALPAAIAEVIAHEEVCSPYGRRGRPAPDGHFRRVFALLKGLRVLARDRARAGETFEAISMLLDGARMGQDLGRGPTDLLTRMLSSAALSIPLAEVQTILAAARPLDDGEREELRRRLDVLARTVPPPALMLRGELTMMDQQMVRPALLPGYVPPGGPDPTAIVFEGEQLARLATITLARDLEDPAVTCADAATVAECAALARDRPSSALGDRPSDALLAILGPRLLRGALLDEVGGLRAASIPRYVERIGGEVAQLRGLRALVAFAARRVPGGCPGVDAFAEDDLAAPSLGGPLRPYALVEGTQLELHAPPALIGRAASDPVALPVILTICPPLAPEEAGRLFRDGEPVEAQAPPAPSAPAP